MVRLLLVATMCLVVILGLLVRISNRSLGSSAPAHAHSAAALSQAAYSPEIDGAEHPELIPDLTAYRLFFLTVAEPVDATQDRIARQQAYLTTAGLEGPDLQSAVSTLAHFKVQDEYLTEQYNQTVPAGGAPDYPALVRQQDELTQATRDELKAALTPEGMARLDAHVQREKRNMKVTKEAQ